MKGLVRGVAGLAAAGAAVFAGTVATEDNTVRDDTGAIVESGGLGAFSMQVGDCFNDPSTPTTEVASVEGVPCSSPHDNEVFTEFDMPDGDFPGSDAVATAAAEGCFDTFASYVGASYEQSSLEYSALLPTSESWAQGDREIVCFVYDMQLAKLTGSVRGTGI